MKIKFFDESIKQFVKELEMETSAKVFRMLELLERFGNHLGLPHSKHIGGGLLELRVRGKQDIRIIYVFRKSAAILLHGFTKKSRKIPSKEIETAKHKLSTLDII